MYKLIFSGIILMLFFSITPLLADWPQWRGPSRNGISEEVFPLPKITEENQPIQLWEVPNIPSDHDGGHGSLVVSKGNVFVAMVWHRDVPTERRQFSSIVLSSLDHRSTNSLDPALVAKMETDRKNLSRRLRGKELEDYAKKWVEENLDQKSQVTLGSWVASRFIKGSQAIELRVLEEVSQKRNHVFQNQVELETWVAAQDWSDAEKAQILSKVPNTEKLANDVILALDAATGKEVWKFEVPGFAAGRNASSTPTVQDGRIYAALSTHLYCVDEATGTEVWKAPLSRKGIASSPMVVYGKVFIQHGKLTAFDAATGQVVWENGDVKASNSSPNLWKNTVLCNSNKEVIGVDAETGQTKWTTSGGGDSSPVVSGDYFVVPSPTEGMNLIAYRLTGEGPQKAWSKEFTTLRYQCSPIIYNGYVYHLGSARHWCLKLETGEEAWERPVQSAISSPILADGKLLVYENRGGLLSMIEATPTEYKVTGKTKVAALHCASPAIVKGDIFFRTDNSVKCFRLQ